MHNVPGLKRFSAREDRTTERFSGGSPCVPGSPRMNRRIETGREGSGHRYLTVIGHNFLFRRGAKMHISSHRLSQNSAQLFLPVHQPTKRDKKKNKRQRRAPGLSRRGALLAELSSTQRAALRCSSSAKRTSSAAINSKKKKKVTKERMWWPP